MNYKIYSESQIQNSQNYIYYLYFQLLMCSVPLMLSQKILLSTCKLLFSNLSLLKILQWEIFGDPLSKIILAVVIKYHGLAGLNEK